MSRLIDADGLLKELESSKLQPTKDKDGFINGWCEGFNTVVDIIRNQTTAFDTEKVVKQLEEVNMNYFLTIANTGSEKLDIAYGYASDSINKAIDIVKKGGVE